MINSTFYFTVFQQYTLSSAWYGKLDKSDGKIIDTHSVSNNRIVAVAMFMF